METVDSTILVGILVSVVRVPASNGRGSRTFVAFGGGEDARFCLEILLDSNMMPKNGFFGALDLREASLTLANYQRYQVVSMDVAPELLGVTKEWMTLSTNAL